MNCLPDFGNISPVIPLLVFWVQETVTLLHFPENAITARMRLNPFTIWKWVTLGAGSLFFGFSILQGADPGPPAREESEANALRRNEISANSELPPQVTAPLHGLSLFADYSHAGNDRILLYLVNRSGRSIPILDKGNYMEVEAAPGQWVRAQVQVDAACGTSGGPLYVGSGQNLLLAGYRPAAGREARVRYVLEQEPKLISNIGTGWVLDSDVLAATKDGGSVRDITYTLRLVLDGTEQGPWLEDGTRAPGPLPGEEYCAALELLWSLKESPRYRDTATLQLQRLDAAPNGGNPHAATAIRATLDKRGPKTRDAAAFLQRCLHALRFTEPANAAYGSPEKHPELIWKTLGELARWPIDPEESSRLQPQWKELMQLAFSRIDEAAGELPKGASSLFSSGALVDEFLPDAKLLEWIRKTKTGSTRMQYGHALMRRNLYGELARTCQSMGWEDRRWVLLAITYGPEDTLPRSEYEIPAHDDDLNAFILSCLRSNPIATGAALQGKAQAEGALRHKLMKQHLLEKAVEWASAKKAINLEGQAADLIGAINYLAEFKEESDGSLFATILRSNCYNVGITVDPAGKEIKTRNFFLRRIAKTILLDRGLSVPEDLKLESHDP